MGSSTPSATERPRLTSAFVLYDYTTVTAASVRSEVEDVIARAEEMLAAVVAPQETRTWESTMAPLDRISAAVTIASGRGPFVARVHPDKEVRDAAQAAAERLSQ